MITRRLLTACSNGSWGRSAVQARSRFNLREWAVTVQAVSLREHDPLPVDILYGTPRPHKTIANEILQS